MIKSFIYLMRLDKLTWKKIVVNSFWRWKACGSKGLPYADAHLKGVPSYLHRKVTWTIFVKQWALWDFSVNWVHIRHNILYHHHKNGYKGKLRGFLVWGILYWYFRNDNSSLIFCYEVKLWSYWGENLERFYTVEHFIKLRNTFRL